MKSARRNEVNASTTEAPYDLTDEQEALIEESIAEIERGEFVDGDEFLAELRRLRGLK